ncbi:predicted protein [Sclerotinia sclerotiorum 1980 UF-70]|uniref:Uncharacterized protein n=2 Tax=Sclerotinia sclerotiorum (strain ATCC 18683 / 1980 / Ss-1) TaxID=665079 RepID=A7F3A2_SCLS1|nr:predicted protein [Sclerotinia sclerotiorum 1980 UF-70]APA14411.1 hypothetical protein sscle_12g091810 [Sclerotinia sclerotiorum 1980 UF-70]EDN97223.1 predicted protein [Sclerotinia sclerotiorum 1980 UF-70]
MTRDMKGLSLLEGRDMKLRLLEMEKPDIDEEICFPEAANEAPTYNHDSSGSSLG